MLQPRNETFTLEAYRRDILPGLAAVPIAAIRRSTGLSRSYCKLIRRGAAIPHPSHWPALAALVAPQDTSEPPAP